MFEEPEKIGRGLGRDMLQRVASQVGHVFGHVPHERRLIALAAVGYRREIGGISLDEHAIERHTPCHVLDLLGGAEGDDARERDVEIQRERLLGHVPVLGEALLHAAHRGRVLLSHDAYRVGLGFARVDNERFAALARRADVTADLFVLFFVFVLFVFVFVSCFFVCFVVFVCFFCFLFFVGWFVGVVFV